MSEPDYMPHTECSHTEDIVCPVCNSIELATVYHTFPWFTYQHQCSHCGYYILEDEWSPIKELKNGTTDSALPGDQGGC